MCCHHMMNGEIPYAVIDMQDRPTQFKQYPYHGQWFSDKSTEIGFYWVSATGAYNILFDGKYVWRDRADYISNDHVNYNENKYVFLYKKDYTKYYNPAILSWVNNISWISYPLGVSESGLEIKETVKFHKPLIER